MKTLLFLGAISLVLPATMFADPPVNQTQQTNEKVEERVVFVTGSLIPRRIQLRSIGTLTYSPVRIIDRREIDQTGRYTTPGAFVNEPSVRVIGH